MTSKRRKLSYLNIGLLLSISIFAQTCHIVRMNKILKKCDDIVCSTFLPNEERVICCINKPLIEYNKPKTEIVYTSQYVNRTNKIVVKTCITHIKVNDIDFNKINVIGDGINEEFSVVVFSKEDRKSFVTTCQNVDSTNATSYCNEVRFNFCSNSKDNTRHKKFVDLIKKLGAKN